MSIDRARQRLSDLAIAVSEENFFKFIERGDREVVELFLDLGADPNTCGPGQKAAVVVAVEAGHKDLARLLLARGASPEPLFSKSSSTKDKWDKLTASSGVLTFISSILIAAVGGYFTYAYNQRQIDLNHTQAAHDADAKEQANKVLELDAVQKMIPNLTSDKEEAKGIALIALQNLAHQKLSNDVAILIKGKGSVQYLQQAAASNNPDAKRLAVQALSAIATSGTSADAQLASQALSTVFQNAGASVVRVIETKDGEEVIHTGTIISGDGYILTTDADTKSSQSIAVISRSNTRFAARIVSSDPQIGLVILKVDATGLRALPLTTNVPTLGSEVIAIGYRPELNEPMALIGVVARIDERGIYFNGEIGLGGGGRPLVNAVGEVVGIVRSAQPGLAIAVPAFVAINYIRRVVPLS